MISSSEDNQTILIVKVGLWFIFILFLFHDGCTFYRKSTIQFAFKGRLNYAAEKSLPMRLMHCIHCEEYFLNLPHGNNPVSTFVDLPCDFLLVH